MYSKELYRNVFVELNKQEAPNLLLDEYNYLYYKAVLQYININYNLYEINQQKTDDLSWCSTTATLSSGTLKKVDENKDDLLYLPLDYFHILNCRLKVEDLRQNVCEDRALLEIGARRLTADQRANVLNNYYLKPSYKRPYFNISAHGKKLFWNNHIIELLYGNDPNYRYNDVIIDYIRLPEKVVLSYELLEDEYTEGDILEFPDNVAHEIINIIVKLCLERHLDPRLQTNNLVNQTIAPPIQVNSN